MKALHSFVALGTTHLKMQHHISEDGNSELHCCVNLKTCDVKISHPY